MAYQVNALEDLIDKFRSLPGVGSKSAQRLAFHVLNLSEQEVSDFAETMLKAKKTTGFGSRRKKMPGKTILPCF